MTTTSPDVVTEPFRVEQQQVEATLLGIMDAVRSKDFARLAAHHLDSPKFSKFDDLEPWDRQNIETSNRLEEEGLASVDEFEYELEDLKVDVFGPVAIATFVFNYGFVADGERMALRARTTMVFVDDRGSWKIAHEHLSAVPTR